MGGVIVVYNGSIILRQEPSQNITINFPADFTVNGKSSHLDISYDAQNGFMPYRGIQSMITVSFPEKTNNTSTVELIFFEARLMNPHDNPAQPRQGKAAKFSYLQSDSQVSTYTSQPYLIYYSDGEYGALLNITLQDGQSVNREFKNVIQIRSWESYIAEKQLHVSNGLAWMAAGIGLIATIPAFTRLTDMAVERKKLTEKAFYE